jgi:hypothetical protein
MQIEYWYVPAKRSPDGQAREPIKVFVSYARQSGAERAQRLVGQRLDDSSDGETDGEDFDPEAGGAVVVVAAGAERHGSEDEDQ